MGLVSLYLKSLLRRKSQWVGSIIGILIASTLMFGAFMATDYAGLASLDYEVSKIPCDYSAVYSASKFFNFVADAGSAEEHIASMKDVLNVSSLSMAFLPLEIIKNGYNSSEILGTRSLSMFVIGKQKGFEGITVEGSLSGIGIGHSLAKALNVSVGDNITLTAPYANTTINITISAIVEFGGKFYESYYNTLQGSYYIYGFTGTIEKPTLEPIVDPNFGLIFDYSGVELLRDIVSELDYYELPASYYLFVGYNRSAIIDPWDIKQSMKNVRYLDQQIEDYLASKFIGEADMMNRREFLFETLMEIDSMLGIYKFQIVFNMVPVLILSIVLALVANWILITRRRLEYGMLKIRGASNNMIFMSLFTEGILLGIISGILGFLGGIVFLVYMGMQLYSMWNLTLHPLMIVQSVWKIYVIPAAIFGLMLSVLAIYFPAKKISELHVSEAIAGYSEEIEGKVKVGKITKIFFIITLLGFIDILLGMPTYRYLFEQLQAGMIFVAFVMILVFIVYMITFFAGPFILPYASAKIMAANAHRFSNVLRYVSRPFSGELDSIATRQFIRKRARAYKVILLLVLTLTFSMFGVISDATNTQRMKINVQIQIGSDVSILPLSSVPLSTNVSQYFDVKGVSAYTRILTTYDLDNWYRIVGIDPNYFDVSFVKEGMLSISLAEAKKAIEDGKALVSSYLAKNKDLDVGDRIILRISAGEEQFRLNLTVAGFIYMLPGISDMFDSQLFGELIVVNLDLFSDIADYVFFSKFLVKTSKDYNSTEIAYKIKEKFSDDGIETYIYVYDLALKNVQENWIFIYNSLFTRLLFYLSLFMAGVGVALTMITSIYERRREIALLRVRGASFTNLAGIILGELAIIILLGGGLGIILALSYSYWYLVSLLKMTGVFSGIDIRFPPDYVMVIPPDVPIFVSVFIVLMFLFTLIPLAFVYKGDISQDIREANR